MKVEDRLSKLEAAVDVEVTSALSQTLKNVLDKHQQENEDSVKRMALEAVALALKPFPYYAQQHVLGVFNSRINQACLAHESHGYKRDQQMRWGHRLEPAPKVPLYDDLLGFEVER